MNIQVVIPHYQGERWLTRCIQSVLDNGLPPENITLVDNYSPGHDIGRLCEPFKGIRLIKNKVNLGFGRACNIGVEAALGEGAEYLVILNQDCMVKPNALNRLVGVLKADTHIALAAPILYEYEDTLIESFFIRWFITQCPGLLSDALKGTLQPCYTMQRASGACLAVRAETVRKFGLFDPIYFMYAEDDDLCRRLCVAGYKIALVPAAGVHHAHSNSERTAHHLNLERLKRKSALFCELKDPSRHFWFSFLKAIKMMLSSQLDTLCRFQVSKNLVFMIDDIAVLASLRRVFVQRNKEIELIKMHALRS